MNANPQTLLAASAQDPEPAFDRRAHARRTDIQLLRALAIVLVMGHHAQLPYLPGGFLGVDIFFVISGYLMTGIIVRGLEDSSFTFKGFYKRRIQRLLPAAYATLTVTALLAPFLLDSLIYRDFIEQLWGSFGFVVNFVLWRQTDYFSPSAELAPLLHMWSLAVEEQFYIIVPLVMVLMRGRVRLPVTIGLTLLSLAACLIFLPRSPTSVFYLMPFRAWQLGLGGVLAILVKKRSIVPVRMLPLRIVALAILLVVPLLYDEQGHPGYPALSVCLATIVLLVPGLDLKEGALPHPLKAVGDRSYSLYLVHWPLFAFCKNLFVGAQPLWVNFALLALCFPVAELQYRFVETRFRRMAVDGRRFGILVAVPLVVSLGSYGASMMLAPYDTGRNGNRGIAAACSSKDNYQALAACRTTPKPTVFLWGDSYAMHLADGLAATTPTGIEQATRSTCGPFLDIAPFDGRAHSYRWGRSCIAFNDKVMAHLKESANITTVVLSSSLTQYIPGGEDGNWKYVARHKGAFEQFPSDKRIFEQHIRRTVDAIHALGKRVILFGPPPLSGYDQARCEERRREGKVNLGAHPHCILTPATAYANGEPTYSVLGRVAAQGIVPVYNMLAAQCRGGHCLTEIDDISVYGARDHLSPRGSAMLGKRFDWGGVVTRNAR